MKSVATGGATGLCLEVHDLAASKIAAGREKDMEFVRALLRHRLADPAVVQRRINGMSVDAVLRDACLDRLKRAIAEE